MMTVTNDLQIKWMVRRELPEVLEIEADSFEFPMGEDDFLKFLRQQKAIARVAMIGTEVVGYILYIMLESEIDIGAIAVKAEHRRKGIATQILEFIIDRTIHKRHILTRIRETNTVGQLLFKKLGFICTGTIKNYCEQTEEDAYVFQMNAKQAPKPH